MESSEDEPDYDTDWSQGLNAHETSYGDSSSEDAYSDYGDEPAHEEPEPEPPDLYHTTPRYPKPWISWNPSSSPANSYPTFHPTRKVKYKLFVHNGNNTYGPEFFLFSGLDYLQWEDNMDYYFEYHSTPQEDKLSIALGQLKGSTLRWWDQDEYSRWHDQRPKIRTWENLKWIMCAKYSPQNLNQGSQTACPTKQAMQGDKTPNTNSTLIGNQGKSSNFVNSKEPTCYRCHKKGHYATTCPSRKLSKDHPSPELKSEIPRTSDRLPHSDILISSSRLIHLSLPKDIDAGNAKKKIGHEEGRSKNIEEQCPEAITPQASQVTNLKSEAMPKPIPGTLVSETYDLIQYGNNILTRHSFKYSVFNDSTSSIKHLIFFLSVEKKTGTPRVCNDWTAHRDDQVGITNNALLQEEPPDHMVNSYTMTTTRAEHNKSFDQVIPFLHFVSNDSNYVIMNLLCPEEFEENSVLVETATTHYACLKPHVIENIDNITKTESCSSVYKNPMTVITHLALVKGEEDIVGTKKKQQENETPRINGDNKCEKGVFTKAATLPLKEVRSKPWRGVIASSLIKEEPPDAHTSSHINRQKYFGQGKFLCSHLCKDTNLLYLGAGEIVSRSKPFQEGEYDEDIKSSSAQEHRTRSLEEASMKLRRAKETSELNSAQMEAKIKRPSSTNTWRSYSTHTEFTTKKNQPERIPEEEDVEDTSWKVFNGRYGDLRSLIESFRSNQEDISYKSNCSRFSTQQRNTANWIWFNQRSYQGVIDFTNRVNRSFPDLDIGALIGGFRSNQKEISYKSTCYGILTQPGSSSNWNNINTGFGVGVIQLLNRMILNLPYLEAHGFRSLQTHIWRPGEYLIQSEASSITSRHLEESSTSFPCTSIHRIRRIPSCSYFPYMTPGAFTLGAINLQRLFPLCCCVLETCSMHLDVPRHHSFAPKLSRLKESQAYHNLTSFKPNGFSL